MNWILNVVILLLAIPVGFLIAYLCRDELVQGRKWFQGVIALCFIGAIYFFIVENQIIVFSLAFLAIVAFISLLKSKDKKWAKLK
jgi:hypothetical protein